MKVYKSDWIAIACVVAAMSGFRFDSLPIRFGDPAFPAPAAELQAVVKPVAALVVGEKAAADRPELAALFKALAEFHGRDKAALIGTTGRLRQHNAMTLQAFYQHTGMAGRYAGLGPAVDAAIGDYLGLPKEGVEWVDGDFTAAQAAKLANLYNALAWALEQT